MTEKINQPRLAAFATGQLPADHHQLVEIDGVEVIIHAAYLGETQFGTFAAMDIELPTAERMWFTTGGMLILTAIKNAIDANAFPLAAKFSRPNRLWTIE